MVHHAAHLPKETFFSLYKQGKRVYSDNLQYIYVPQMEKTTRFSVVVGKKIHKHAVRRNRMKRIVRVAFTQYASALQQHIDCLIIVKKDIASYTSRQIGEELRHLALI